MIFSVQRKNTYNKIKIFRKKNVQVINTFADSVKIHVFSVLIKNIQNHFFLSLFCMKTLIVRGGPRGVIVKAVDCGIVVREFVLQSRYYVHFRANTLGKGMNPVILPAMD